MNDNLFLNYKIPDTAFSPKTATVAVRNLLIGTGFCLMLNNAHATGEWSYMGSYNSNGTPDVMVDKSGELPADLLSRVLNLLPEGVSVPNNRPTLITNDIGANIFLKKDAQITVAFVSEGAGFSNGVGFFQFTKDDFTNNSFSPADKIFFANASTPYLRAGNAVDLGNFTAGTGIGFTVVANGWKSNLQKVDPNQSTDWIFRTLKGLNPEPNTDYRSHTVLLSSPQDGMLVLGIEDLNRDPNVYNSDDDFNDVVLAIFVSPADAVDTSCLNDLETGDTSDCDSGIDPFAVNPPATGTPAGTKHTGFSGRLNWREKADVRPEAGNSTGQSNIAK